MSLNQRLDGFQRRHRWAGFPLAVVYKFFDDQGSYLAALITYYGFLSLFPLLLLLSTGLGLILQGSPHLQEQVLHSTLSQFPVIGTQLQEPKGLRGSVVAVVLGCLTALYGALGVAQAFQHAMNTAWAVPRNRRPNPIAARLRSLLLLGTAGLAVLGTTVLSALGSSAHAFGASLSIWFAVVATLLSVTVNAAIFMLAFRISTVHKLSWREAAPGALTAAVLWQVLQSVGTAYVGHVVKNASATNGVFALVIGLIAWMFLASAAVVLCVEINVVRAKRLYPRALLTPFTDNVDLTHGDQQTYADSAVAQRTKEFESVDVSFDNDGQNASAQQDSDSRRQETSAHRGSDSGGRASSVREDSDSG
jgi:membrane protein